MKHALSIGAFVGGMLAVGFWAAALRSLDVLDQQRIAAAEAAAVAANADALPAASFRIAAGSDERARAMIAATLRRRAAAGGLLIERLVAESPVTPAIARLSVTVSGPEKGVLTLADAIEREEGGVRWHRWRIESPSAGTARLTGTLAVAWR